MALKTLLKNIFVLFLVIIYIPAVSQSIADSCFASVSQQAVENKLYKKCNSLNLNIANLFTHVYKFKYGTKNIIIYQQQSDEINSLKSNPKQKQNGFSEFVRSFGIPVESNCGNILSTVSCDNFSPSFATLSFKLNREIVSGDTIRIPIYYYSTCDVWVSLNSEGKENKSEIDFFTLQKCDTAEWHRVLIDFVAKNNYETGEIVDGFDWLVFVSYGNFALMAPCCSPKSNAVSSDSALCQDIKIIQNQDELNTFDLLQTFILPGIFFETNKAVFKPDSSFEKFAHYLNMNMNIQIEIVGYSDNVGDPKYNLKLSKQRAEAVYNEFLSIGIEENRMNYSGKGAENPVADNNTEEGRQKNRRVEIIIIRKQ